MAGFGVMDWVTAMITVAVILGIVVFSVHGSQKRAAEEIAVNYSTELARGRAPEPGPGEPSDRSCRPRPTLLPRPGDASLIRRYVSPGPIG